MAKRAGRTKAREGRYQVFLSHSSVDLWIAKAMRERIEDAGVRVWLDAFDVHGGDDINQRIKQGVRSSDECLILLSPASRHSDWVRHEVGMADGLDKRITLILLYVEVSELPDTVRGWKHLGINEFDDYLAQVAERMHSKGMGQ